MGGAAQPSYFLVLVVRGQVVCGIEGVGYVLKNMDGGRGARLTKMVHNLLSTFYRWR